MLHMGVYQTIAIGADSDPNYVVYHADFFLN